MLNLQKLLKHNNKKTNNPTEKQEKNLEQTPRERKYTDGK